jgi:AcrR family transcriptional regulator
MIEDIKTAAKQRLATEGPNLSLRAVARDIGVVSSAVYRYFASRDELLTALIIDAYDDLGAAVEQAEGAIARRDLTARWMAFGRSVRSWARAHPHEYALLYGSPVPGYAAPQDTVGPASRPVIVLAAILRDLAQRGTSQAADRLPRAVRADLETIIALPGFEEIPPATLARGMTAWAQVFGSLSFELFGRLTGAVTDFDAYFDHQLKSMAAFIGL